LTATNDPIGLTLASLGAGSATGAALVTAGMVVLRAFPSSGEADGFPVERFYLISSALLVGIVAAVFSGWHLTRSLEEPWRRGVVGALSVFGTALLSTVAMPVDFFLGIAGLTVYLAALIAAIFYSRRTAHRAAGYEP